MQMRTLHNSVAAASVSDQVLFAPNVILRSDTLSLWKSVHARTHTHAHNEHALYASQQHSAFTEIVCVVEVCV